MLARPIPGLGSNPRLIGGAGQGPARAAHLNRLGNVRVLLAGLPCPAPHHPAIGPNGVHMTDQFSSSPPSFLHYLLRYTRVFSSLAVVWSGALYRFFFTV